METQIHGIKTYTATIYCGLMEGYRGRLHGLEEVRRFLQKYVDERNFALSVAQTRFMYPGCILPEGEPGITVTLMNYPRFPCTKREVRKRALTLGKELKSLLGQQRLTVVFPDETVMLGEK